MTKRKLKDAYLGGRTIIKNKNKSWFSKKSTKVPPNSTGKPPPRSRAEQRAFDEFAGAREPPKLIRPTDETKMTQRQKAKYRLRKQ